MHWVCESLTRQLEQLSVALIAGLDSAGSFVERGYSRPGYAVADLLGLDRGEATRRVKAAEQVMERRTLEAGAAASTAGDRRGVRRR